jgi:hypothetical protein
MFFQRGTLHLVQPAPLCKQVVAHYTFLEGKTLKKWLWRFYQNGHHLMETRGGRSAARR